jgi:hypothetical protein
MAWWRFRRGRTGFGLSQKKSDGPGPEVALLRLEAEVLEESDFPRGLLPRIITELEEHLPELELQCADMVRQHLGPRYMPARILIEEGSIVLLTPIHSVAEAAIYYVGLRQALELLLRDFRSAANRWLQRSTHAQIRVVRSVLVPRPPLEDAEIASAYPREHDTRDLLLTYLVASHAILLVAVLTAGGFLLAHVI